MSCYGACLVYVFSQTKITGGRERERERVSVGGCPGYLVWVWRSILPWWAQDWGRGGEGGEVRSDPRAGLLGREVMITQNCVCENLQVQAGHRTRQLLHIICMDGGNDVVNKTHWHTHTRHTAVAQWFTWKVKSLITGWIVLSSYNRCKNVWSLLISMLFILLILVISHSHRLCLCCC